MPSSREMAQRYAAASKRKKRREGGPRVIIRSAAGVEESAGDADTAQEASPVSEALAPPRSSAAGPRVTRARPAVRRTAAEADQDYTYVPGDLRRVAFVAGGLLVALIVLAFVFVH
jgi:hypothetical protein